MRKAGFWLFILSLTLGACVDEIYLDIPAKETNLVIDAWIGPSTDLSYVRVYRSASFQSGVVSPNYTKVPVRQMYVEGEDGLRVNFRNLPDTTLYYRAETYQVFEPGKRFRLNVFTEENEHFQSEWVKMPETTIVNDFEINPKQSPVFVYSGNNLIKVSGVTAELNLNLTNPSSEEVGFLIDAEGISEVLTTGDAENCKCNCYLEVPQLFSGMNLESNASGNSVTTLVTLAELDITSLGRFYLQATIKTVAKENLEYLRQIDKQQRSTGSIFDPAPFKIKGNFKNLTNPNKEVMGNFVVYQENTFTQMIYRAEIYRLNSNLSFAFEPTQHVRFNCNEYFTAALPNTPQPFQP